MSFLINADELPIGNGGGTCKTVEDVKKFSTLSIPIIEIGSITEEVRLGNNGNTFYSGNHFSLNSLGMPNGGRPYYEKNLSEMIDIIKECNKRSIVNVAGFSTKEYSNLTKLAFENNADYVVLNFGCPNVWGDGKQKGILSHDPPTMKKTIACVLAENALSAKQGRIGIKLSPLYPSDIQTVANYLNDLVVGSMNGYISFITTTNTVPNCYEEENDCSVISPGGGLAGMAGSAVGPIARGQVRQFRNILHPNIRIIGVGGIHTGKDVQKMLGCGADFVQLVSAYYRNFELGVYDFIGAEYYDWESRK